MSTVWFEQNAKRNEDPPDGLNLYQLALYSGLRYLYSDYRAGHISKGAAQKVKAAMVTEYEKLTEKAELLDRQMQLWIRIEPAYYRYQKDKTIENADAFMEAVYGVRQK